jgi:DNA-binding MarR family transcriptional regulator
MTTCGTRPCQPARPPRRVDTEAARLNRLVRALVRRFAISERADVACCGMTVAQAATLGVLRGREPVRLKELGRRLGVDASTLTRNIDRLRAQGLVVRAADPGDARGAAATLTPAGRRAAARVERQDAVFARGVLERIDPVRRVAMLESLADLLTAVRAATEACCPGAFDHLMEDFPPTVVNPRGAVRARRTRT